jgi:hypothetical protein
MRRHRTGIDAAYFGLSQRSEKLPVDSGGSKSDIRAIRVLAFRSAPARATVLAGHLLNSLVRNIEIRGGAFGLAIPAKIPAKRTAAVGFCLNFQCVATIVPRNPESSQ